MNADGTNVVTLLTEKNNIALPKALGVLDSRLYYLDPLFDKIERVDLPNGDNPKLLVDNEADLKTFIIYKKRQGNGCCLLYGRFDVCFHHKVTYLSREVLQFDNVWRFGNRCIWPVIFSLSTCSQHSNRLVYASLNTLTLEFLCTYSVSSLHQKRPTSVNSS